MEELGRKGVPRGSFTGRRANLAKKSGLGDGNPRRPVSKDALVDKTDNREGHAEVGAPRKRGGVEINHTEVAVTTRAGLGWRRKRGRRAQRGQ